MGIDRPHIARWVARGDPLHGGAELSDKISFRTDEELDNMILSIMELRGYSSMSALMRKLIMEEDERMRAGDRECSNIQVPLVKGYDVHIMITPREDKK